MKLQAIYHFLFPAEEHLKCQNKLMILGIFGTAILYILRFNLSVAIVAMVGRGGRDMSKIELEGGCPLPEKQELHLKEKISIESYGELAWDEKTQGRVHAAFFYGYLLTNFIGGHLADKIGGQRVFGGGILLTSLLAFLLPMAARHSEALFSIVRVLQGVTEGVTFPAMNSMMTKWVQPSQRPFFMSRFNLGIFVGPVLVMFIGGWLCETRFGWQFLFHLSGIVGIIWSFFWFRWTSDSPRNHPFIDEREKAVLQEFARCPTSDKPASVPWRKIFTSPPFLATIVAHFGNNFGFYYFLTELPTYLASAHHFDIKNNGLVSALPFLCSFIASVLYSALIYAVLRSNKLTIKQSRKMSTALGSLVPMVMMLLIPLAGCNSTLVMVFICMAISCNSFNKCGFICSFQDLAPNFAGTLCGISNTFATIPGFLAPIITGAIIHDQPTIGQWNKIFLLSSFIYFVSGNVYLMFMSTNIQPWNNR